MDSYLVRRTSTSLPRLPLDGNIDLTYRCNNACLHCWLWKAPNAREQYEELIFDEIRRIGDESRALGTRRWLISGGEPMLRADFPEIFDYLTRKSASYSLNSNGTLITPEIAQLLKRKGMKMIALYGATADVYDSVTRNPGGFEDAIRGMRYLREAGAGFIVQLIPMRANWHQWEQMQELARSLSPIQRFGPAWIYLSADGTPARNAEIGGQRLPPRDVVNLDKPNLNYEERIEELSGPLQESAQKMSELEFVCGMSTEGDDRLFARCITKRRGFHIDPYGGISWCSYIKDPALRYDLRKGTFREAWEEFIPGCADKIRGGDEWRANCGSCEKRAFCRWCAVFGNLETGRHSARVPYLCAIADETRKFKIEWEQKHRRYFQIAGMTVRIESDLNLDKTQFRPEFSPFAVDGPGDDNITLRHYFGMPDLEGKDFGEELYHKVPWVISRKNGTWFYRGIFRDDVDKELFRLAVFDADHRHGTIYSPEGDVEHLGAHGWHSLSLFPTDQIWLVPLLAQRNAVLIHSGAAIVNGNGLVFVGHSSAGKSTTMEMLKAAQIDAEILCDDRNVLRKWENFNTTHGTDAASQPFFNGWRVHGTWSHGTTSDVSGSSAPLRAIMFLQQDTCNKLVQITDPKEIWRRLFVTLIRSTMTAEIWQKEIDVLEKIVREIPCYVMHFDKSGEIVEHLVGL